MRHRKHTVKLGRVSAHRDALLSSLVGHLIERGRVRTTLVKAKAVRPLAEHMVTLARRGTLAARRQAIGRLRSPERVARLFAEVAPAVGDRAGGYTRILRLGRRPGDGAEMALIEWTHYAPPAPRKRAEKATEKSEKK
jgi:large subunit ribosomal protein L17